MPESGFVAVAWNNGSYRSTGAGFGLKVSRDDRDRYFRKEWSCVYLRLPGLDDPLEVNIKKKSFWNDSCRELINIEIGRWMIAAKLAPWARGKPPRFKLIPGKGPTFELQTF
jgi:hypothetical protein